MWTRSSCDNAQGLGSMSALVFQHRILDCSPFASQILPVPRLQREGTKGNGIVNKTTPLQDSSFHRGEDEKKQRREEPDHGK